MDLTEIDDADSPALTTRQHSVVSEGPVDKGDNKTTPHVSSSDPSWHVSGQTQEHKQTEAKGKKQRRHKKQRGPRPKSARSVYKELEGERTKHQRKHKDKTDQGSGLSVGFH